MKKIIWIIIVMLLVAGGVIAVKKKRQNLARIPPMTVYHQVVEVTTPTTTDITLTLPALAELRSDRDVTLSSRLSSRIISIARSGDMVHKGQVVVTLDHADLLARKEALQLQDSSLDGEISAQEVSLKTAEASHKRTKVLLDAQGASVEQYDTETSRIASLKAGLQSLQSKKATLVQNIKEIDNLLSYAVIESTIDGMVSSTFANAGDMAMPGKPLLSIQAEDGKYLLLRTADTLQPTKVNFEGKSLSLTPLNHTFMGLSEFRADVDTSRSSGERLPVQLVIYHGSGVMIPLSAILQKDKQSFCFIPENEHARPLLIKIIATGTEGAVVEGLTGQKVIVAQPDILLKLLAGTPISIK